jgi:hypothetical protein
MSTLFIAQFSFKAMATVEIWVGSVTFLPSKLAARPNFQGYGY